MDANLLLLYFVGTYERDRIERFKKTSMFTAEDYDLLASMLDFFERVVTTPHVLTEVSNLAATLSGSVKRGVFEIFSRGMELMDERQVPADQLAAKRSFVRFGITDSAIEACGRQNLLVVTVDWPLYQYLTHSGIAALNFNHVRGTAWR